MLLSFMNAKWRLILANVKWKLFLACYVLALMLLFYFIAKNAKPTRAGIELNENRPVWR
jgi:hypothetical protein